MNRITLPLSLLLVFPLMLPVQAQKNGRQRNRNVGIAALVSHSAVHKELKLKDEQATALKQAAEESRKGWQSLRVVSGSPHCSFCGEHHHP